MRKSEMIEHINKQYAEYLGHDDLVCCTSYNKARYKQISDNMNKALAWQKLAKRIHATMVLEFGEVSWMFIFDNARLAWLRDRAAWAYHKASNYWYKS